MQVLLQVSRFAYFLSLIVLFAYSWYWEYVLAQELTCSNEDLKELLTMDFGQFYSRILYDKQVSLHKTRLACMGKAYFTVNSRVWCFTVKEILGFLSNAQKPCVRRSSCL